jgi:large subunit ribosomal protein L21
MTDLTKDTSFRSNTVYAVIEDSGQQFRVSEGDVFEVDLRDLAEDVSTLVFDRVLLVSAGDDVKIGTPLVDGATVEADVLDREMKGQKVHAYKMRRRKNSRRKIGHRQRYVKVKVTKISA